MLPVAVAGLRENGYLVTGPRWAAIVMNARQPWRPSSVANVAAVLSGWDGPLMRFDTTVFANVAPFTHCSVYRKRRVFRLGGLHYS
jgi:histidinol-phosphate/aromatic aminotransferase/cobyric acid decarboxylase-like protein